jgi:hypothetical protein
LWIRCSPPSILLHEYSTGDLVDDEELEHAHHPLVIVLDMEVAREYMLAAEGTSHASDYSKKDDEVIHKEF